ncbi:peptidoglycan-binding domain-containing protein [Granulosicoccaceae sp. 1_MG-2023]|nr:peptidoglycan-binding domain-containing protein [Granulosicoccaceae sp. 1_MG-2023]
MKFTRALTFATASLISMGSQAQLLTNPAAVASPGNTAYGVWLGSETTDYELERSGESGDINRSMLAGSIEYGAHELVTIYGSAAYVFDVENGNGHQFQLGAKGPLRFIQMEGVHFNWYSALSIHNESLGEDEDSGITDIDNVLSEWLIGAVAVKPVSDNLSLYAGLELVPYSLGEATFATDYLDDYKTDFERDSIVGLRAGVIWNDVEFHLGLGHETSVLAGVRLPFGGYDYNLPQLPTRAEPAAVSVPASPASDEATVIEAEPDVQEIDFDPYANQTSSMPQPGTRESLRLVQQKLNFRGYQAGVADGLMGKRTRAALIAFQRDQNLPQTGQADSATLRALGM